MKTNIFKMTLIFFMIGIVSLLSSSTVFADAHESEGEMAPEAEAMDEKPGVTGWFQIDIDSLGSYFLIGANHPIGDGGVTIASNIYINDVNKGKYTGEFDLGVNVPMMLSDSVSLALQPMVGIGFDYTGEDGPDSLYPQIFAFLNAPNIFFFHWTIATVSTVFDDMSSNELYNRSFLTYSLNDTIAIGPQFETVFVFVDELDKPLKLNVGARINIAYGTANSLGLYVGYETKKVDGDSGLTGRMNFTRFW